MDKIKKTFEDINILTVEGGTNCPQGGDAGHGGRTKVRWKNEGGTSMWVNVVEGYGGEDKTIERVEEVEIVLGGDTEAETFIDSLEYIAGNLRYELEANKNE